MSPSTTHRASIVIPAHNEQTVIGRLLHALLDDAQPDEFDVIVVCNGCTDATASIARSVHPDVRVVETPVPSKAAALRLGDADARTFPRIYVDADVVLDTRSVRALIAALDSAGTLAVGPDRQTPMDGASWAVRAYYRVWLALPHVAEGLFGRGVVAVSEAGYVRLQTLPDLVSDDLAMSQAFAPAERQVVHEAQAVVRPPRTLGAVLKRKTRSVAGNTQLEQAGVSRDDARTSVRDLAQIARRSPRAIPGVVLFLGVAAVGRRRARRQVRAGDYTTWHRDDSSRQA